MNYQLTAGARLEMSEAQDHYESERSGLGNRFVDAVEEQFRLSVKFPTYTGRVGPDVYFRRVRKFPYLVIYCLEDDHVLILSVVHDRRKPGYWQDRLPKP